MESGQYVEGKKETRKNESVLLYYIPPQSRVSLSGEGEFAKWSHGFNILSVLNFD